jgi:hypothetical protein
MREPIEATFGDERMTISVYLLKGSFGDGDAGWIASTLHLS